MDLLVQMPVCSTSTVPILKDYSTFILRSYRVHPTIPMEYSNALVYAPTCLPRVRDMSKSLLFGMNRHTVSRRHIPILACRNCASTSPVDYVLSPRCISLQLAVQLSGCRDAKMQSTAKAPELRPYISSGRCSFGWTSIHH